MSRRKNTIHRELYLKRKIFSMLFNYIFRKKEQSMIENKFKVESSNNFHVCPLDTQAHKGQFLYYIENTQIFLVTAYLNTPWRELESLHVKLC